MNAALMVWMFTHLFIFRLAQIHVLLLGCLCSIIVSYLNYIILPIVQVIVMSDYKGTWHNRYYRQAYQEFFMPSQSSGPHSAFCNNKGYISDYHRFGWLLFLALRVHAFSQFKDLVTCTNGLVSILVSYHYSYPLVALQMYLIFVQHVLICYKFHGRPYLSSMFLYTSELLPCKMPHALVILKFIICYLCMFFFF